MDPVRRALFLLLLASVLVAEPGQMRAAIADRTELPAATATARFIHELAVTLRRAVRPAAVTLPTWHAFRPAIVTPPTIDAQVAVAHPAREPHAFRLPPPQRKG